MPAPNAPLRILLVEDNPGDALLVQIALDRADTVPAFSCAISVADSIAEACYLLTRETPDVIVTDLGLPDGQGVEIVTALIAAAPGIPLIVLSGDSDARVMEEALQNGAADYLHKEEFTGALLIDALRRDTGRNCRQLAAEG